MSLESKPLVNNAGDEGQLAAAAKKIETREFLESDDLKWVLSTPKGRRVMVRILDLCRVDKSVFHASGTQHAYNSGQQDVGLQLKKDIINIDPDLYLTMIKESFDPKGRN